MEEKLAITHTCQICGKGFSSGKAYGGHWRSHIQKANNKEKEEEEEEEEEESESSRPRRRISNKIPPKVNQLTQEQNWSEGEEAKLRCNVCNMKFTSRRALGGHMRAHPEREWRGIDPPRLAVANPNPAPPSDQTTSSSVDLTRDFELISWLGREKRSRSKSSSPTNSSEDEIVRAAKTLVKMSNNNNNNNDRKELKVKADRDSGLKFRIMTRVSTKEESSTSLGEIESLLEKKRNNNNNWEIMDENVCLLLDSATKESDDNNSSNSCNLPYKCLDCDKSFSSFQGLGGHRSSHSRHLINGKNTIKKNVAIKNNSNDNEKKKKKKIKRGQFQVKISYGEKRLDFDLNELPGVNKVEDD